VRLYIQGKNAGSAERENMAKKNCKTIILGMELLGG